MNNISLTEKIREVLNATHKGKDKTQSEWTTAFIKALQELGESKGYKVYPNEKKIEGEWLFDLCWAKERKGEIWQTGFEGLKLACEIEWNKNINEILYDFQKLTVVEAEIRLMIFQFNDKGKSTEIIETLKTASEYTKPKGYRYLIAASGNNEREIILEII